MQKKDSIKEELTDISELEEDFENNSNHNSDGFHKGDTMVLIGDYTDDSDYAFYMNFDEDELSSSDSKIESFDAENDAEKNLDEQDSKDQNNQDIDDDLYKIENQDEKDELEKENIAEKDDIYAQDEDNEIAEQSNFSYEDYQDLQLEYDKIQIETKVKDLDDNGNEDINDISGEKSEKKVKNNSKINKKFVFALIAIFLLLIGAGVYRLNKVKVFPKGTVLNGIEVDGLNPKEASLKMDRELNIITLVKDGTNLGKADTLYKFESKKAMKRALIKSAISPYYIYNSFRGDSINVPLKVIDGIDQTVPNLLNIDQANSEVDQTKDAYIDLEKAKIVPEHQGVNVDYLKVSKQIAKNHKENPSELIYEFKSSDYYAKPKIKSGDLNDELKFAKKYIVNGMDVETPTGVDIHIAPDDLSKIIKYSKDGPKYSREGADEVAKIVIEKYSGKRDEISINTTKGERSVINYDFVAEIDEKGTAKSIYNSAKKRTKAKIETSSENKLNLANRVEIDLSNQTITLVREDKSIGVWPIVTGGPGYRTPPGLFALAYKTSPATLKGKNRDGSDYESHVTFWMPFNGGIGIHDADGWRSAYGGSIYVYGGSHGCVNVPYSAAETIFYNVSAGMPVIVHY